MVSDSGGRTVSLGSTDDASGDASRWVQSAEQFRRWRAGDSTALDDMVAGLTPVLWHVVRAYGLEREQAEDVVQSTWLTLVRRHESITDTQAVSGWLITTARREAWRVAKAAKRDLLVGEEAIAARLPAQQTAEAEVVAADEHSRLWAHVQKLSPRCQRLLRIVAFEDRPDYAGLATELGMPVGSIGPTRGRCLDKLKALISPDAADGHRGGSR